MIIANPLSLPCANIRENKIDSPTVMKIVPPSNSSPATIVVLVGGYGRMRGLRTLGSYSRLSPAISILLIFDDRRSAIFFQSQIINNPKQKKATTTTTITKKNTPTQFTVFLSPFL
jgi:hypothetical protein